MPKWYKEWLRLIRIVEMDHSSIRPSDIKSLRKLGNGMGGVLYELYHHRHSLEFTLAKELKEMQVVLREVGHLVQEQESQESTQISRRFKNLSFAELEKLGQKLHNEIRDMLMTFNIPIIGAKQLLCPLIDMDAISSSEQEALRILFLEMYSVLHKLYPLRISQPPSIRTTFEETLMTNMEMVNKELLSVFMPSQVCTCPPWELESLFDAVQETPSVAQAALTPIVQSTNSD